MLGKALIPGVGVSIRTITSLKYGGSMCEVFERMKSLDFGQLAALVAKLERQHGDDAVMRILKGELELVDAESVGLGRQAKLVDKNGRCIPHNMITGPVEDASWDDWFKLDWREESNVAAVYRNAREAFEVQFEFGSRELRERVLLAESKLLNDSRVANLIKGRRSCPLVTIIPTSSLVNDYSILIEEYFGRLKKIYKSWNGKGIYNFKIRDLSKKIEIISGTGHRELMNLIQKRVVPGIYFPNCLRGWSTKAQREVIKILPSEYGFSLGGGIDVLAAMISNMGLIDLNDRGPSMDISAVASGKKRRALMLGPDAEFTHTFTLSVNCLDEDDDSSPSCSGGIFMPI